MVWEINICSRQIFGSPDWENLFETYDDALQFTVKGTLLQLNEILVLVSLIKRFKCYFEGPFSRLLLIVLRWNIFEQVKAK